jgi:hypothetical protein
MQAVAFTLLGLLLDHEERGSTSFNKVIPDYTASHPRRQYSSISYDLVCDTYFKTGTCRKF